MHFASDNTGPTHPSVWDAMRRADQGCADPYGDDKLTMDVCAQIKDLFEAPQAEVFLISTGTAANTHALASITKPWDAIFCTPMAHIEVDESTGPEFATGGARMRIVEARDGKMHADALRHAVKNTGLSIHNAQRGPVALTNVTEVGTVYSPDETAELCEIARSNGLKTFLDGARFANACAALNASPADITWRAGIDVVSFGGTKNGLLGVEAVIFFNPEDAAEFPFRRKRAGHLISKGRYLAAQMDAYLQDDLWLHNARLANAACAELAAPLQAHPEIRLLHRPQANIIFARFARGLHQKLFDAGAHYYIMDGDLDGPADEDLTARFVCDWSAAARVAQFQQEFVNL